MERHRQVANGPVTRHCPVSQYLQDDCHLQVLIIAYPAFLSASVFRRLRMSGQIRRLNILWQSLQRTGPQIVANG